MLELTLATEFVPGTNLKGNVAGANWSFLLPSLELERVVCVGVSSAAALATLSRIGREVLVVCERAQQRDQIDALCRQRGLANVRAIAADGAGELPLAAGSADLLCVGVEARKDAPPALIARYLKPDGVIYFEVGGDKSAAASSHVSSATRYWVTPMRGEMQTAVPANDQPTIDYFVRNALYAPAVRLRLRPLKRVERFVNRRLAASGLARRYGVLAGRGAKSLNAQPPRYLQTIAGQAGVDLTDYRWGLAAHGQYTSRKVLFFLFEGASETPAYVVKMTRDRALNPRLENEQRALMQLAERALGDRETLPGVAFYGHHGGLAIVGETVVAGVPFRKRADGSADCRYLHAAVDWLIELGAATADPSGAPPHQVAKGLETLFNRFTHIYQVTPEQREFLASQIATIAASRAAFPLVFQHGDPGSWNILATPSGGAAFLDWEAFEQHGMPLWDLFYFLRSYGVWSARKAGTHDSLKGFSQQYLADSALGALLVDVTRRYCERSGLAPELVEPLFYTCWMHRSLKEAARLPTARLERGHYVSLLRLCIQQRNAPTLRRLFSLRSAA
jgi:protein-L-isoaspartate O-methyltransferase